MIESDNSTDKSYEDQPILPLFPQQTATKQLKNKIDKIVQSTDTNIVKLFFEDQLIFFLTHLTETETELIINDIISQNSFDDISNDQNDFFFITAITILI